MEQQRWRRGGEVFSFTVTSSASGPSTKHMLNPAAKAFEVPLFATPAGPRATDYTTTWAAGAQHPAAAVDEAVLQQQLEEFVRKHFGPLCEERQQHMVIVSNLEQRTSRKQLSDIFFPMGASEAVVMAPAELPPHLGAACQAGRRRVGVVFFPRKDFAMVGVEKLNDFVPNGQHQPLTVRYCGPDAEGSQLSGVAFPVAPPPWVLAPPALARAQVEMMARYGSLAEGLAMIAVHGLDPDQATNVLRMNVMASGAVGCEPWPPQGSPKRSWACRSMSAVVWYPTEAAAFEAVARLNGRVPLGQSEPLVAAVISPSSVVPSPPSLRADVAAAKPHPGGGAPPADCCANTFAIFDEVDQQILATTSKDVKHLVSVHNLAPLTDKKKLFKIFYPMGAFDAEVLSTVINVGGKQRRSGVAFFSSEGMAREAATKIHNFVPHGQARPLAAHYLRRDAAAIDKSAPTSAEPERSSTPVAEPGLKGSKNGRQTPKALLQAVKEALAAPNVDAKLLAELMVKLAKHKNAGEAEASALSDMLSRALQENNALLMSTPLSNALTDLHRELNIRRVTSNSLKDASQCKDGATEASGETMFVRLIARSMMMLLLDHDAQREARRVAAVLCAYFFEYPYLPGTPYTFAVKMLQTYHEQLQGVKTFLCSEACTPVEPAEEQRNRAWVTLIESLEEMTSLWQRRNKARAKKDGSVRSYDAYIADFYGTSRGMSAGSGASTPLTSPADASVDHGATQSSKRSTIITPSARPTPRRVVTRSSPSGESGSGGRYKQPSAFANDNSRSAPQVTLSPLSDHTQGVSADVSVESNVAQTLKLFAERTVQSGGALKMATGTRQDGGNTVYVTKLPSNLTSAQARRLFLQFGEFTKVRLCRENQESVLPETEADGINHNQICFGFVEFADSSSAKAMVEYFRNAAHHQTPFLFLRGDAPVAERFTEVDIQRLCNTRTSQARNRIHDQQFLDAVMRKPTAMDGPEFAKNNNGSFIIVQPCLFGVVLPHVKIEAYAFGNISLASLQLSARLQERSAEAPSHADPNTATPKKSEATVEGQGNKYQLFSTNPANLMGIEEDEEIDDVLHQVFSAMQKETPKGHEAEDHQDTLTTIMALLNP